MRASRPLTRQQTRTPAPTYRSRAAQKNGKPDKPLHSFVALEIDGGFSFPPIDLKPHVETYITLTCGASGTTVKVNAWDGGQDSTSSSPSSCEGVSWGDFAVTARTGTLESIPEFDINNFWDAYANDTSIQNLEAEGPINYFEGKRHPTITVGPVVDDTDGFVNTYHEPQV